MLNVTNIISRGIIAVVNEGKDIERYDVGVKGGNVMGKRNNKKGGKPLINYNS